MSISHEKWDVLWHYWKHTQYESCLKEKTSLIMRKYYHLIDLYTVYNFNLNLKWFIQEGWNILEIIHHSDI